MSLFTRWTISILSIFHTVKKENLKWQEQNQAQQIKLYHAQIMAEKQLETELKKRTLQLEHEISLLNTQHEAKLAMLKTKCQQEIKDYKHYLNALDQLKIAIQKSYPHLPEAIAFTIHHHAKQLLNAMWETEDFQEKMQLEMRLIQFMTTVHEESRLFLAEEKRVNFPEKTLALIKDSHD